MPDHRQTVLVKKRKTFDDVGDHCTVLKQICYLSTTFSKTTNDTFEAGPLLYTMTARGIAIKPKQLISCVEETKTTV